MDTPEKRRLPARLGVLLLLSAFVAVTALFVGARYGALLIIGLGLGLTLESLRFGFAGPWRAMITRREPAGLVAQLLAIGCVAIFAFPLLAAAPEELVGAHAPVGVAMVGGAFVFGLCMQLVLGCGSGTLVNAGSGNAVSLLALPFFAIGSFSGAYHLDWWIGLGTAPTVTLIGLFGPEVGLLTTLFGLAVIAAVALKLGAPQNRTIPRRLWLAATIVAALAILNLVVAGQPWGVVYGLGLWAAKGTQFLGVDLSNSIFWSAPGQLERLSQSIFTDVTSLTNIGIILGAFTVALWRGDLDKSRARLPLNGWVAAAVAGFLLGYSSRLAFGCNVGAFFSGVSTGSLHGWAWFAAAFAGSFIGVRLRPRLGLEPQ
ncbi:MAG: YeeE/YedE family protein [Rhodospirillales bacterium]